MQGPPSMECIAIQSRLLATQASCKDSSEVCIKFSLIVFGYFDPINVCLIIKKTNNLRGDLSDVPAKTAALGDSTTSDAVFTDLSASSP